MEEVVQHKLILDKTIIQNFRLFEEIEIDFDKSLTVFISENGSGKTSILDIIAKHLEFKTNIILKRFSDSSLSQKTINYFPNYKDDINNKAKKKNESVYNKLDFTANYIGFNEENKPIIDETNVLKSEISFDTSKNIRSDESDILNSLERIEESIDYCINENILYSLPVFVYYPCAYVDNIKSNKISEPINKFSAWDDALNGEAFDFKDFVEWFKWQYNIKLKSGKKNKIIETITNAVLSTLNDEESKFKSIEVDYSEYPGNVVISKNNDHFKLSQLSSGEKSLIVLVADLARRLTIANPALSNPLIGNGIVLIDEIDIHLHPKWQRKIILQLQKVFPNIQFIVTTHSPFVIQSIKNKKQIKILDGKSPSGLKKPFGYSVTTVLDEFFGIESEYGNDVINIIKIFEEYKKKILNNEINFDNSEFQKWYKNKIKISEEVEYILSFKYRQLKYQIKKNEEIQ